MKWGKRKIRTPGDYSTRIVRGYTGPGRYIGAKRQLASDKKDLRDLDNGKHLSFGLTKKRQAAFDARDRARLEKRITKNETKVAVKNAKKQIKGLNKTLSKTNAELDAPYRQPLGDGVYANWPSKRKFIQAEIDRLSREINKS